MSLIRVKDFMFKLSEPYEEGHECTGTEARMLNQLRSDYIRNAVFRKLDKIKSESSADEAVSSARVLELLNEFVKNLDAEYEFPTDARNSAKLTSIQKVAEELAREKAISEMTITDGEDWLEMRTLVLSQTEEIFQAAKKRIENQKLLAELALKELID